LLSPLGATKKVPAYPINGNKTMRKTLNTKFKAAFLYDYLSAYAKVEINMVRL